MNPYQPIYAPGSIVTVKDLETLETFRRTWKYHHPLTPEQLVYANHSATVESVNYYHGGDQLYVLSGVPGIWHPENLTPRTTTGK
jgi:hypothetical protein